MFFNSIKKIQATWSASAEGFNLLLKGKDIAPQSNNSAVGEHLIVYYPEKNVTYLLNDYFKSLDGEERPAEILSREDVVYWSREAKSYSLYYNGQNIGSKTVNAWSNDDLVVYFDENQTTYLLENFNSQTEFELSTARIISQSDQVLWRAFGSEFIAFFRGSNIVDEIKFSKIGQSMLVYHETLKTTYLFEDYFKNKDNIFREARSMANENVLLWSRSEGNRFNLFRKGDNIAGGLKNARVEDALLLFSGKENTTWLLPDFFKADYDQLFEAELISNTAEAFWRARNGDFWIYYRGENIGTDIEFQLSGKDLMVVSNKYKVMFALKNFKACSDNRLRPIE